jgi:hypothetical protein
MQQKVVFGTQGLHRDGMFAFLAGSGAGGVKAKQQVFVSESFAVAGFARGMGVANAR